MTDRLVRRQREKSFSLQSQEMRMSMMQARIGRVIAVAMVSSCIHFVSVAVDSLSLLLGAMMLDYVKGI